MTLRATTRVLFASVVGLSWLIAVHLSTGTVQLAIYVVFPMFLVVFFARRFEEPWAWLFLFYLLYTATYPIALIAQSADIYRLARVVEVQALGCYGLFLGVSAIWVLWPLSVCYPSPVERSINSKPAGMRFVVWASVLIAAIGMLSVFALGFESKREINDAGNLVVTLSKIAFFPMTLAVVLLCLCDRRPILKQPLIIVVSITGLVALLSYGERDIFFRMLIIFLFVYFSRKSSVSKLYFPLLLCGAFGLVALSEVFKGVLLDQGISVQDITGSLTRSLFTSEFSAATRNLYVLFSEGFEFQGGKTYLMDLNRVLNIRLFPVDVISASGWFNSQYRVWHGIDGSSGWGFGMINEMFINFGRLGVFAGTLFLGSVTQSLYKRSGRTVYHQALYFMLVTFFIYSLRQDAATLLSLTLKAGAGIVIILYATSWLSRNALATQHPR